MKVKIKRKNLITDSGKTKSLLTKHFPELRDKWWEYIEKVSDGIIIVQDGVIKFVNFSASKLSGYSIEELIDTPFINYIDHSDASSVLNAYTKRMAGKKVPSRYEVTIIQKNGRKTFLDCTSDIITFNNKPATLSIVRNITDYKLSEEKLKVEKAHLTQLFEKAPLAMCLTDSNCNVLQINKEFTNLFGFTCEDLQEKPFYKYIASEEYQDEAYSFSKRAVKGEKISVETLRRRKDGTLINVLLVDAPIKIDNNIVALYSIYTDITKRKQAEQKIRVSLKEKEVMLQEIHHRVKNNMQVILSLLRLQFGDIKSKRLQELYKEVMTRIRSIALIHDKLYRQKNLTRIDFSEYIIDLTTHLFFVYDVNKSKIRLNLDVRDVHLDINKGIPCGLIINELVSNSLKHAFPGDMSGVITVKMNKSKKGKYVLTVKDTGAGLPDSFLDLNKAKTLGLQLVNDLAAQLNGSINIENTAEGATFNITF